MASAGRLHLEIENMPNEKYFKRESAKARGTLSSRISSILSTVKSRIDPRSTAYRYLGTSSYADYKVFLILKDFLQPDTNLPLHYVVDTIAGLFPRNAALSTEVWSFGVVCLELAQQIPYQHPSQQKLVRLLEHLAKSEKVIVNLYYGQSNNGFYHPFERLAEYMGQYLRTPSIESSTEFINLHAFIANLHESHIFRSDPTYAIWAMHDAFEIKNEPGLTRDTCILIAAQWILWNGQSLFTHLKFPGDVSPYQRKLWAPGDLYDGEPLLDLDRWRFWRDGFKNVAEETGTECSDECKSLARKAVYMMDAYGNSMMF
ncbi:hypothetical protein FQN54_002106 [Arachnomyces sp. PD_36]|nr:hypothetical protein FQN54_002106 [Arachnomyces sp. PD_36]